LLSSAFFCLAGLNVVFSSSLLYKALGLKALVLMSAYLDRAAWATSASAFGWICIMLGGSARKLIHSLGAILLTGSVLQILRLMFPLYGAALITDMAGDFLVACAAVAVIVMVVRNSKDVFSISSAEAVRMFFAFLFSLVVPLQVWSIATLLNLPRPQKFYPRYDVYSGFEELFGLLFPVTVALLVLLVTEWLWLIPISRTAGRRLYHKVTHNPGRLDLTKREIPDTCWRILLGVSLLLGIFISAYQWSRGYPLGQDARYYSFVLRQMDVMGLQAAFSTERPFLFLALHFAGRVLSPESPLLLRLVPSILSVILIAATYCFVRFVGGSEQVAALAVLFAAVSPHVTVGVDIYIIANWLGISLMMLFLYCFFISLLKRSRRWTAVTIALSGLILGVHYFTWIFMMVVVLMYFLLSIVEMRGSCAADWRFRAILTLGCFSVTVPALILASTTGQLFTSLQRVSQMTASLLSQATPWNFLTLLMNQERSYEYFAQKHYAIPLLYGLGLIGAVRLGHLKNDYARLVKSWLIVACLGLLAIPIDHVWRFLYMIPIEILAAFGLSSAFRFLDLRSEAPTIQRTLVRRTAARLILFLAFGIMLAFSDLPSFIILLCPVALVLLELSSPSGTDAKETTYLLVTFIALEQIARALYALG